MIMYYYIVIVIHALHNIVLNVNYRIRYKLYRNMLRDLYLRTKIQDCPVALECFIRIQIMLHLTMLHIIYVIAKYHNASMYLNFIKENLIKKIIVVNCSFRSIYLCK